ncbi:MAG: extracellular solute-binding protein [Clostridia bacterium]|nr:extracellular solute-binding protein [Clostridia bacterium]
MKKLLSLACVLALLVSVLAIVPQALAEDPIEITYFRQELDRNAVAYYNDTAWVQEIEKRLNIKLKILGPASSDDYNTAVNAMLVSGEYPDLLFFDWNNNYPGGVLGGVEDEVIVPISEIPEYKEKVPNWFKVLDEHPEVRRPVTEDDGSVVVFCHWEPNIARSAYWGYAVRKDWLDRLGLEVPKTIDEFYAVLKAFKENDANGNGDPNDEIPFSCCNWWGTAHPGMDSLAAAWTLKVNTMYRDPHKDEMTYWTEYNNGENFKQYVETMAKWYQEGLIDEEAISQKFDPWAAKITGDKVGSFFCFPDNVATWEDSIRTTMKDQGYGNPDDVCIYGLVPLLGPDGVPYNYDNDNALVGYVGSGQPTVITTAAVKNGHIDKCLELLNFLYSEEGSEIVNWGVEGLSYTKDADGNHAWTDLVKNDPDYPMSDAVFKYALPTLGSWPKAMSYEAWGSMNLQVEDQILTHKNYAAGDNGLDRPGFSLNMEEQDTYSRIITDVNTAVSETYMNVITGQKTMEDLDALLAQVKSMGIADAVAAFQSAYARYLTR